MINVQDFRKLTDVCHQTKKNILRRYILTEILPSLEFRSSKKSGTNVSARFRRQSLIIIVKECCLTMNYDRWLTIFPRQAHVKIAWTWTALTRLREHPRYLGSILIFSASCRQLLWSSPHNTVAIGVTSTVARHSVLLRDALLPSQSNLPIRKNNYRLY